MADQPQIPDLINIPTGVLDRWLAIPSHEQVEVALTRQDFDNLFFSINNLVSANAALQQCLISFSNGKLEEANLHMVEAQSSNATGLNKLRLLFTAIMANADRARTK